MSYALHFGLDPSQLESIKALWECVANLPEKDMKHYMRELKEVAMMLEMDSKEFYDATGGYYLYSDKQDYIFEEDYE